MVNKKRGFSLAETIVYTGLAAVLILTVINLIMINIEMHKRFRASRNIQDNAIAVIERIVSESRNASTISTEGTGLENNGEGSLTMINANGDVIKFSRAVDGTVHVFRGPTDIGPLTTSEVNVQSLAFWITNPPNPQIVRIELVITSGIGETEQTKKFYTSVVPRGSYGI